MYDTKDNDNADLPLPPAVPIVSAVSYVVAHAIESALMALCRGDLTAAAGLRSLIVLLTVILRLSNALQYVPGSPCASLCSTDKAGSINEDAVCLDREYKDTTGGQNIEKCVGCLLNSTAIDTAANETDVQWGLCMYSIWSRTSY